MMADRHRPGRRGPISVRLSDDEQARFEAYLARTGRNANAVLRAALSSYLEQQSIVAAGTDSTRDARADGV